jgi:hypothetical protein
MISISRVRRSIYLASFAIAAYPIVWPASVASAPADRHALDGTFSIVAMDYNAKRLTIAWDGTIPFTINEATANMGFAGSLQPVTVTGHIGAAGEPLHLEATCELRENEIYNFVIVIAGVDQYSQTTWAAGVGYLDLRLPTPRFVSGEDYRNWTQRTAEPANGPELRGHVEQNAALTTFSVSILQTTYDTLYDDYHDYSVLERTLRRAKVQIFTSLDGTSWYLRTDGDLDANGAYNSATWNQTFPCKVRIRLYTTSVSSSNRHVDVTREDGWIYQAQSESAWLSSGNIYLVNDFHIPSSLGDTHLAFAAFGSIQDAWLFFNTSAGESVGRVDVLYPSGTWPWHDCATEEIQLPLRGEYFWVRETLMHEYGHQVQCNEYGSTPGCAYAQPSACQSVPDYAHWASMASCPEFAFTEGWAEFVACAVDSRVRNLGDLSCYPQYQGIETNQFFTTDGDTDDGCITEGSVASIWWDILDGTSTSDLDHLSLGFSDLYNDIFERHEPTTTDELAAALTTENYSSIYIEEIFNHYGCEPCPGVLAAPTLLTPPNGATCVATAGTMDWSDVAGATQYEVQIGTSCGTGSSYQVTSSQYAYSGLAANTTTTGMYGPRTLATTGATGPRASRSSRTQVYWPRRHWRLRPMERPVWRRRARWTGRTWRGRPSTRCRLGRVAVRGRPTR